MIRLATGFAGRRRHSFSLDRGVVGTDLQVCPSFQSRLRKELEVCPYDYLPGTAASETQTSSLSFRVNMHCRAKAGCDQTTRRPG